MKVLNKYSFFSSVILLLIILLFFYNAHNENDFVSASKKSIDSVVTVLTPRPNSRNISIYDGVGSGVLISKDGHIVTNYHVIAGKLRILIRYKDKNYEAKIVGFDSNSDLAVLKVNSEENFIPIRFAKTSHIKIGEEVLAIGNPYGIGISVSSGIISAMDRHYENPYIGLIQTDAAINPGNSGGPLLNKKGNLIGINSKIYSKTGASQGLNFAIPIEKVIQVTTELIKYGKVRESWIGNFSVKKTKIKTTTSINEGVLITSIDLQSPLSKKGVRAGDIIIKVNESPASIKNLLNALDLATIGDQIEFEILSEDGYKKIFVLTEARN